MVQVRRVQKIHGHPWVRALVEVDWHGLRLRGLKLEEHAEGWRLCPPGRRIGGQWQSLFSIEDRQLERALLESLRLRHG